MRSEWTEYKLEDCTEALIDYRGKSPKKSNSGIPLVTAKIIKGGRIETPTEFIPEADYEGWMRRGIPRAGDVVMTTEAPLGEIAQLDGKKVALAQRVVTLRGKSGFMDNDFLKYLMLSEPIQQELRNRSSGTTVVGIRQSELRKVPLPVPPLAEQHEIAAILRSIDDKIANNRALAADLEAMARTIFKSWFVDFDPVKAKMEGRAPVGMDADTAALFPDALVESELGLIPEGWEPATLASKADLNPESWTARNHPDSVLYADLAGTDRGQIVETKSLDWADAPSRARRVLRPGDTIVGTVRPGNRAYSYVGVEDLTGSTGFAVLRPHEPSLRSFTYLAATADEAIERLTNLADGAAYPAVRPDVVAATPIVAAPCPVVEGFAKITQPLLDWMVTNHAENAELAQLRDTLLPRLISGKLQLPVAGPEAEPLTEEDGLGV